MAWHSKEVTRSIYDIDDADTATVFVAQLGIDLQDDSCPPEVQRLGRMIVRWQSPDRRLASLPAHERADRSDQQPRQAGQVGRVRDDELDQLPHPRPALRRPPQLGTPQPVIPRRNPERRHTGTSATCLPGPIRLGYGARIGARDLQHFAGSAARVRAPPSAIIALYRRSRCVAYRRYPGDVSKESTLLPVDRETDFASVMDPDRLAALRATGLLDSAPEEAFDRITRLAERLLNVPVALISLVDRDRQFFKSNRGLTGSWAQDRQSPLSHSYCKHAVEQRSQLVIGDAREDLLVRDNPATSEQNIGAYAGEPLETSHGEVLGTLCVIDHVPRDWQPAELELLAELSALAVSEIEFRVRAAALREVEDLSTGLEEPIAQLGEAVRNMVGVAERAGDPLVGRLATLARTRLLSVEAAAADLFVTLGAGSTLVDTPRAVVPMADRLMRASRIATASLPDKNIRIEILDRPLPVRCDPRAMDASLSNMLVSAMQHSGDDPVDVSLQRKGESVALRIRCDGRAMPVAELARLVSQINAAAGHGDEGDAALSSSGGITSAAIGVASAHTGPTGTTLTVVLPLVGSDKT